MADKILTPIAIFAGLGQLPWLLIQNCLKENRRFVVFLLEQERYELDYSGFSPFKIAYGEVEKFLQILKKNEIKHLVFVGGVTKPNFSAISVDKKGAILLAKILANKILGDDTVLKTVIKFLEKEGLKMLRIEELLDCVVSNKTVLTEIHPSEANQQDIELGIKAIRHFASFDVGQSVIVAQKQIIAVEALEGTDAMISRCQNLKVQYAQNAVLIKMKKPNQSQKADLPTIGIKTVENCAASKIQGIAIQANSTLIIDKASVIKKADELGLFLKVF